MLKDKDKNVVSLYQGKNVSERIGHSVKSEVVGRHGIGWYRFPITWVLMLRKELRFEFVRFEFVQGVTYVGLCHYSRSTPLQEENWKNDA